MIMHTTHGYRTPHNYYTVLRCLLGKYMQKVWLSKVNNDIVLSE